MKMEERGIILMDDEALMCPNCGNVYLHQDKVTVFNRDEDEETEFVAEIQGKKAKAQLLPSSRTKNPSARRQGLTISFYCECCPAKKLQMHISQHKGTTYFKWDYQIKMK